MNNYYVYIHRRKDTNNVFYVGISRMKKYVRVKIKAGRNSLWCRIAEKYGYYGEVIHSGLTKEEAIKIEMSLIKSYGRINLKNGCLANLTDGGDGSLECIRSEETRNKLKNYRKGKKHSEETKQKMALSKKGKFKTTEWKNAISKSMIGKNSKRVIDKKTGKIFNSVSETAIHFKINRAYLSQQLLGIYKNKTDLEFYVENPQ